MAQTEQKTLTRQQLQDMCNGRRGLRQYETMTPEGKQQYVYDMDGFCISCDSPEMRAQIVTAISA